MTQRPHQTPRRESHHDDPSPGGEIAEAATAAKIQALVARAPPLDPDRAARLALLLRLDQHYSDHRQPAGRTTGRQCRTGNDESAGGGEPP
jgi:hypothetical protein